MTQRIHNLSKWVFVDSGHALHFDNTKIRTVILDVNCPEETRFYCQQNTEDLRLDPERVSDEEAGRSDDRRGSSRDLEERAVAFIGLCKGRDRLEFGVAGAFDLIVEGGEAYIYTADSTDVSTVIVEPVIFTKIANRRQRNPHLEMIEYQMRLNQDLFRRQMEAEVARRIGDLEHKYAAERVPRKIAPASDQPVTSRSQEGGAVGASEEGARDESSNREDRGGREDGAGTATKSRAKDKASAVS